ncbi:MAG: ACT domain-containing protein [Candidatus Methanomethylophilaceae archaeon]|jgi:predicted regulator of amino acid metabolism with ACT domain|nr:ACT domain-containing protein [Candidatus Methanomethylophilaceae archaeon]
MKKLSDHFQGYPSQEKVARMMLRYGIKVKEGSAFCGNVEISDSALGRAAGVDRRIVKSTVDRIMTLPDLRDIYSMLEPTCLLAPVAPILGWSVLEIVPTNAGTPGILAEVAAVIAAAGVSIRQAIVDDPELSDEPRLMVVTDSPVPPDYIPALRRCIGVRSIILH